MGTDFQRTVLWVFFGMSLFLLWDRWLVHTGKPSMFGDHADAPARRRAGGRFEGGGCLPPRRGPCRPRRRRRPLRCRRGAGRRARAGPERRNRRQGGTGRDPDRRDEGRDRSRRGRGVARGTAEGEGRAGLDGERIARPRHRQEARPQPQHRPAGSEPEPRLRDAERRGRRQLPQPPHALHGRRRAARTGAGPGHAAGDLRVGERRRAGHQDLHVPPRPPRHRGDAQGGEHRRGAGDAFGVPADRARRQQAGGRVVAVLHVHRPGRLHGPGEVQEGRVLGHREEQARAAERRPTTAGSA